MKPSISAGDADRALRSLAARLEAAVDDLVEIHTERGRVEVPEWMVDRPELFETQRRLARGSYMAALSSLRRGAALPDSCPADDLDYARNAARLGAAPELIAFPYRLAQQVQWEGWFRVVEGADFDAELRHTLLERGSRFFFDYANRVSRFVLDEYLAERERLLHGHAERRSQLVAELLAGGDVSGEPLGYDVDGWHVGVIIRGPQPGPVLEELAGMLDRRLLQVSVLNQTWAWLGGGKPMAEAARTRLVRFDPPARTTLGFGLEERGREGFRRTHQQAGYAFRVAPARPRGTAHYEEVALEALATRDEAAARGFVAHELTGLDGDDVRSRRLRETLQAYFAAGHNAALTASRLGIHEQTVAQRLRAVEERIGRPVAGRRAELETALRIQAYLG